MYTGVFDTFYIDKKTKKKHVSLSSSLLSRVL